MSYYNTNKESGEVLKTSYGQVKKQEEVTLEFFQKNPVLHISPEHIWNQCFGNSIPLTSVRRAITNLTYDGLIEKTDKMVEGMYGKLIHTWKLCTEGDKSAEVVS